MGELPTEILHQVFIQLPLFQRLECMLVCRQWWNILHHCSLLYNVSISRRGIYNKFIDMIKQTPSRAAQVHELSLSYCFDKQCDKRNLCNMFPNLRQIKLIDNGHSDEKHEFDSKKFTSSSEATTTAHSYRSKINTINDYGKCELTCYLIDSGLCSGLRVLQINLSSTYDTRSDVIPRLKNMPTLEYLTLSDGYITIEECELIHSNLPSVRSFNLDAVYLVESGLNNYIQPANLITSLTWRVRVMSFEDIDTHVDWCHYMSKKYTKLTHFDFFDLESSEYGPDYVSQLFRYGLFPILKENASSLRSLRLNCMPYGVNVFKRLDDFGCKIERLHIDPGESIPIFQDLALSNQSNYIQKLTLESINIYPVTLLKNMTALTDLSVTCCLFGIDREGMTINLNTLLKACPNTLKSLSISDFRLEFNSPTTHLTSIESLHIACTNLTKELNSIIPTCFPKLLSLTLFGHVSDNLNLFLPNHHLSSFSINGRSNQPNYCLSLKSSHNSYPKFYAIEEKQSSSNIPSYYRKKSISLPPDELHDRPVFTLECSSINRLVLDFHKVDLVYSE